MRFGRDFEFDVVDLTLKHSMFGFVTLLVLIFSQSFVVVFDVIVFYVFLRILCIGAMSNFLHNIDSQDGPKGCGCGISLNC